MRYGVGIPDLLVIADDVRFQDTAGGHRRLQFCFHPDTGRQAELKPALRAMRSRVSGTLAGLDSFVDGRQLGMTDVI
jgi:hypothetical protein